MTNFVPDSLLTPPEQEFVPMEQKLYVKKTPGAAGKYLSAALRDQMKKGDLVVVSNCLYGHEFEIGEIIKILTSQHSAYLAVSAFGDPDITWWIEDDEVSVWEK
mgnify:CR=1 FL=1